VRRRSCFPQENRSPTTLRSSNMRGSAADHPQRCVPKSASSSRRLPSLPVIVTEA
jgi:hypothetical protein